MRSKVTARPPNVEALRREVDRLQRAALELEKEFGGVVAQAHPSQRESVRNFLHYLAVRRHDIRKLQAGLGAIGLSSLGRIEGHALASLNAVLAVLDGMRGIAPRRRRTVPLPRTIAEGDSTLARNAAAVLGPNPRSRTTRIMVTMPTEAADDPAFIRNLLQTGMDIVRINCAHDSPAVWSRMVRNLRMAEKALKRSCLISFDLAGPKLRLGPIQSAPGAIKWRPIRSQLGQVITPARVRFCSRSTTNDAKETTVILKGSLLSKARVGDRIRLIDSRKKSRNLHVVECDPSCCVAETTETAYVVAGTRLVLRRHEREIADAVVTEVPPVAETITLRQGDKLDIVRGEVPGRAAILSDRGKVIEPAMVSCALPTVFASVRRGHRVFIDDGKIMGIVRDVSSDRIRVKVMTLAGGEAKLRSEKGLNLPDTDLKQPAMTDKDRRDLAFAARHGDIVAMSFVQRPGDIDDLLMELNQYNARSLSVIIKIETRQGFERLPAILIAAMRHPAVAVMVARGDLGVEVGFERLSEVQEEILWLSEAAHMPVIWATQVLESLAKTGIPSRAEVTDAAMSGRAECVMLNKGPYIRETLHFLCDVLTRMKAHQSKKTPLLRRLNVSELGQTRTRPNLSPAVRRKHVKRPRNTANPGG